METHKDNPCNICGDVGFDDLIATCSQCSIGREHVYCMWIPLQKVPDVWCCESCELSINGNLKYGEKKHFPKALTSKSGTVHCDATHSVGTRKLLDGSARQNNNRRQKIVENAKVKFISPEEAIMLSSGIKKVESTVQSNLDKSSRPSITMASMSKRIFTGSKITASKFSQLKVKENPSFGPPGLSMPSRQINVKQAPQSSKKSKGDNFCVDDELRSSNVEQKTLLNILSTLHIPNPPRMDATWKGSFEILGSAMPGKPYDGFWAHPPSRVHKMAYEFSKRMPAVLQFELLPRCNLWADIFQDVCPDEDDIALYIVPGDFERSEQNYVRLLEVLETDDLVMKSFMDGVELLIFTSKQLQLHVDSQKLKMKYFLWGVFRCLKANKAVTNEHKVLPLLVSPLEYTNDDFVYEDERELSDMEIDMIGGKNVGSIDAVVLKESIRRVFGSSREEHIREVILQKSEGSGNFVSTTQQPLLEVKRERCNDHDSPGFIQKVKSEFASERLFQSSLEKLSNATNKLDFPPGFERTFRH